MKPLILSNTSPKCNTHCKIIHTRMKYVKNCIQNVSWETYVSEITLSFLVNDIKNNFKLKWCENGHITDPKITP